MFNNILPRLIFSVLLIGILGYAAFRFAPLYLGPQISLVSPSNGQSISTDFVDIELETKRVSELTINGLPIFINKEGKTIYRTYLELGIQSIKIEAKDIYKKSEEIEFSVIKI